MGHSGQDVIAPASGARLEAVSGPLKGKLFRLTNEEVSIGRDPSNEISLLDGLVSRRHCVIRKDGDGFRLQDLESRNNTFVSGVPIRDRVLDPGDEIRIGNSIFIFQGADTEPATGDTSLQLDATPTPGGPTVLLRKEDLLYLQPQRANSLPATAKTVRDLIVLLDSSRALNSVPRSGRRAAKKSWMPCSRSPPADRVAILLTDNGIDGFSSIRGRDRRLGANQPVHASQTILTRVLEENLAVLSNDVLSDESLSGSG